MASGLCRRYDASMSNFTIGHMGGPHGNVPMMVGSARTVPAAIAIANTLPAESKPTITDEHGETLPLSHFKVRYGGVRF